MKCKVFPVISSHSLVKLLWDLLVMLTTIAGFIWIPLFYAFKRMIDHAYLYSAMAVYSIDILLSLNSGFYSKGQHIHTRGKIIFNYF